MHPGCLVNPLSRLLSDMRQPMPHATRYYVNSQLPREQEDDLCRAMAKALNMT